MERQWGGQRGQLQRVQSGQVGDLSNVIEFGELRLRRAREQHPLVAHGCQHRNILFDDNGGTAECEDCKKQLDLYWVLGMLSREHERAWAKVTAQHAEVQKALAASVELRAAQRVEKAWRSRTMAPACPHCHEAILPGDGFGGLMLNRKIALARRPTREEPRG